MRMRPAASLSARIALRPDLRKVCARHNPRPGLPDVLRLLAWLRMRVEPELLRVPTGNDLGSELQALRTSDQPRPGLPTRIHLRTTLRMRVE